MFGLRRPERRRSAGVSRAPAAATTARARTCTGPASTPTIRPALVSTRLARTPVTILAPAPAAFLEPRPQRRLLRSERAAVAARAAEHALLAAEHVARHP